MDVTKKTGGMYALVVILLAVFAVAPLEYPGAFESHSGLSAVYNLINLGQDPLQFFNWAPTFGRAFDLFRMEGALPYWIAGILHLIGLGYLDSIKLVYAIGWACSGLAMFALARHFFSEAGALVASSVYLYLPFHIATVYIRGSFAESVIWAILPLGLLAVFRAQTSIASRLTVFLHFLPFTLLYLTEPGLALLFGLFAICLTVVLNWSERGFMPGVAAILAGLGVGALLSLPVVMRYGARISPDGFSGDFVLPYQLFSSLWGTSVTPSVTASSQGTLILDQFRFQLGVVSVSLAIIAATLNWGKGIQQTAPTKRVVAVFLTAAVVLVLLMLPIAAPLWGLFGVFASHPWQLLSFVGLVLAFSAASIIDFDPRLSQQAMLAFFVSIPVVASYGYLAPRYLDFFPSRPQIATFGNNEIALLDYRIVGPLRHGATVRIEARWQALRAVDHDYTVFVHAIDDSGKAWAQDDSIPQGGALPTIKWMPGQVVFDTHTIQIDVEGPREGYHLEFGLYQAPTGERALIETGADQLVMPRPGDPPPTISDQLPPSTAP